MKLTGRIALVAVMAVAGVCIAVMLQLRDPSLAERFLERHMSQRGRVVRASGDTVSEGQAYAMLLAVGSGDRRAFGRAWSWARDHLLQPEGYMAWHWDKGKVMDHQPAPDADIDAAAALALAADRFQQPAYRQAAEDLARAVMETSTVEVDGHLLLAAGPWATSEPVTVNPSYFDPAWFALLRRVTGDERWARLDAGATWFMARVDKGGRLPPDWARVDSDARIRAISSPSDTSSAPTWGFDAFRVPIRFGSACSAPARAVAASEWPLLASAGGRLGVTDLKGNLIGAAAAADAAGAADQSSRLLDEAATLTTDVEDYYSDAWVALGDLMLRGHELRRCR